MTKFSRNLNWVLLVQVIILSLSLALANNDRTYQCDPKNRPNPNDCTQKPIETTCGYYKKNCPFEICGSSTYNGCAACSDPNVLYYKKSDCKPEEVVQTCSSDLCNPDFPQSYEPVCAIRERNFKGDRTMTFENACQACKNKNYPWFQTGVCEDDKRYCKGKRPTVCNAQYKPVCAHFTTEDVGSVFTIASNGCEACSDSAVDYYTEGACGALNQETTYCLPNNRPEFCTLEYNPVCGFYKNKDDTIDHRVMGNACSACGDPDILYHIPGPCVFKCNRNPNIIFECVGTYEPVCGTYTQNGKTYQVSLRNGCIGCYYSGKPIETYTDGLCPGDQGIRCENDAGAFLEGILNPVCGFRKEKCRQNSCRTTFAEPIRACSDPKVIWYKDGECPQDRGVPCDSYRKRPSDGSGFVYQNVCGFTRAGSMDYVDQYEACENRHVLYFDKGPCK